jgi:arabinose-5-phosphate isomerase
MRAAVVQLAERRGIAIVADSAGTLLGVITTGDLTRLMEREKDFLTTRVESVMTKAPKTAAPDELGSAVVYRMEQAGIMAVPVVDAASRVVGVVHLHDLMRAGAA